MSLGMNTESASSGEWIPYIKYDARAGRWFRKTDDGDEDITNGFKAVFDFATIQVGWLHFAAGVAPQMTLVDLGQEFPERPSDQHKQGFKCNVVLSGGGVYELASSAKSVMSSIDALHDAYIAAPESAQGQLPVVEFTGTTVVETTHAKGTNRNYSPNLSITGWCARPSSLPERFAALKLEGQPIPIQQPAPVAPAPPATSAAPVAPPVAQVNPTAAPAPAADAFGEFG